MLSGRRPKRGCGKEIFGGQTVMSIDHEQCFSEREMMKDISATT
jgi:hypothetical protein